ncbi:MAG: cold shock domain-containing protein [Nitrospira sp.]|nr:cold shock domain-containing protein [Nitrospira sp.]
MTGRIKSWSTGSASGFITAEDGVSVYFHSSAVLEYDIASLSVGQLVTFELMSGHGPTAANVCVYRQHHVPRVQERRQETVQLRYMGFEQIECIRAYRFQRFSPGDQPETFIVTADLALFRKHHVGMQEGPSLCLQALMAELSGPDRIPQPSLQRALTDADMLTHLASRPVPVRRPHPRATPRPHHASHPV